MLKWIFQYNKGEENEERPFDSFPYELPPCITSVCFYNQFSDGMNECRDSYEVNYGPCYKENNITITIVRTDHCGYFYYSGYYTGTNPEDIPSKFHTLLINGNKVKFTFF